MGFLEFLLYALLLLIGVATAGLVHALGRPPRKGLGRALARGLAADPGELGHRYTERLVDLPDGERTPLWRIEGHRAAGPLVVITHGWGDSRYGALSWVGLFLPIARAVGIYDMRAHGDHTARVWRGGETEIADLGAVIEALQQEEAEAAPVVLFGYSMGAGVAIDAAAELGQRVGAVIADSAFRWPMEPVRGHLRARGWPAEPMASIAGLFLAATGGSGHDRALTAARLTARLLLIHGEDDALCPIRSARALQAAAPRAELVAFGDTGHVGAACADPEAYAATVERFLAGASEGGGGEPGDPERASGAGDEVQRPKSKVQSRACWSLVAGCSLARHSSARRWLFVLGLDGRGGPGGGIDFGRWTLGRWTVGGLAERSEP